MVLGVKYLSTLVFQMESQWFLGVPTFKKISVPNGKLMGYRCPNILSTVVFQIENSWFLGVPMLSTLVLQIENPWFLGVPILKHISVPNGK